MDHRERAKRSKDAMAKGAMAPGVVRASDEVTAFINETTHSALAILVTSLQTSIAQRLGQYAPRANLLGVVINSALLALADDDLALTVELTKHLHDAFRTAHAHGDEAEAAHLAAMEAMGVIMAQLTEAEMRALHEGDPPAPEKGETP